jgi:hypothetical protein
MSGFARPLLALATEGEMTQLGNKLPVSANSWQHLYQICFVTFIYHPKNPKFVLIFSPYLLYPSEHPICILYIGKVSAIMP